MSNQKPRTIEEQIRLLRSRGMAFGSTLGLHKLSTLRYVKPHVIEF